MHSTLEIKNLFTEFAQTPGASDLLITVGKPPQLRVFGDLICMEQPELIPQDTEQLCLALLNNQQVKQFETDKEIDISTSMPGLGRFRINIYQQRGSCAMAARIVSGHIQSFTDLGLPSVMEAIAQLRRGLVLITGPTGTGKSTTVAAIVDYINRNRSCHIICIEDPVEFMHAHQQATVDQREIGADTHSYREALRRVLRQSPDVIVIGEVRDQESAQAAITLAETGHVTLATLHTRGAMATVDRLIDMFPPEQSSQIRAQLSASLAAIIWQQLLPRKDKPGLIAACEVMTVIPAIRALIRQGRTHEIYSAIQSGRKYGMCTMEQAVDELIQQGIVDSQWIEDKCWFQNTLHQNRNLIEMEC